MGMRRSPLPGRSPPSPDTSPCAAVSVEWVAITPDTGPREEPKTFEICARTYVAAQAPGWKSGKHAKQWLATLERYAFPAIGRLDVSNVTTNHLLQILQPNLVNQDRDRHAGPGPH